jgi:SAM-dependent methyltransferase
VSALTTATVEALHEREPGITEDLLTRCDDGAGATPYGWLVEALGPCRTVLDVACGSAPLADLLADRTYVGVDRSAPELRRAARTRPGARLVRGDATALPLAGPFDGVAASMALMVAAPLADVLAEVARVLAPGGLLVATLPSLLDEADSATTGRDAGVHAAALERLGRSGVGYAEPVGPAALATRLTSAGLVPIADEVRRFAVRIEDLSDARLLARSYYALDASPMAIEEAASLILREAAGEVGYPLRRIIARRR